MRIDNFPKEYKYKFDGVSNYFYQHPDRLARHQRQHTPENAADQMRLNAATPLTKRPTARMMAAIAFWNRDGNCQMFGYDV